MSRVRANRRRVRCLTLFLSLVLVVRGTATVPTQTTVQTPYGPLKFTAMKVIQVETDRPCGFMANVENTTGIRWEDVVFVATITGFDSEGNHISAKATLKREYLDGDVVAMVSGPCDRIWPHINVAAIAISLASGTPDKEDIAAFRRDQAARKRSAEEAAARSAFISKLPVLCNGNDQVFVGSDQKCSEQFVQALSMDGLEKRKRVADLLTYGCGFLVKDQTHVEIVEKRVGYLLIKPVEGPKIGKSGWVPTAWIK